MRPGISVSAVLAAKRFRTFPSRVGADSINVLARSADSVLSLLSEASSEPAGNEHMFRLPVDGNRVANSQSGQKRDVMRQDAEIHLRYPEHRRNPRSG